MKLFFLTGCRKTLSTWSINTGFVGWNHTVETTGCSNRPSSKAAGSEAPGAYREVREEAERLRTPLVAFFSILLMRFFTPGSLFVLLAGVGLVTVLGCGPSIPAVTVPQIIQMSHAGVPTDQIIQKIKTSGTVYRLHANQIVELNEKGVSDRVLNYMQQTYLDAVRRDQALEDWDNYALGQDGFWYGGNPVGWSAGYQ